MSLCVSFPYNIFTITSQHLAQTISQLYPDPQSPYYPQISPILIPVNECNWSFPIIATLSIIVSHKHCASYIVPRILCDVHCATYIVPRTLCHVHRASYIMRRILCDVHCATYIVPRTLCDVHYATYIVSYVYCATYIVPRTSATYTVMYIVY